MGFFSKGPKKDKSLFVSLRTLSSELKPRSEVKPSGRIVSVTSGSVGQRVRESKRG